MERAENRPSFRRATVLRKSVRTALEVVLLVVVLGFVAVRLENPFALGAALVVGVVAIVLLLLWAASDVVAVWLDLG